ncbi:MAG TPA: ROK family protein, partial [Anaerovoracaceae bacterium]|nr:ROK family protein [Anaerovoracaceae bacterium]
GDVIMKVNIGVEIGAKFIQAGIVDKFGRLLARSRVHSNYERGLKEIVSEAVKLIFDLMEDKEYDLRSIRSIGVACPGVPDEENSKIMKTYILGLYNAPIRDEFKKHFPNTPIYVENDAHCAAIAESVAGAAEDLDYSITINIGTGISGGIIIDNKLYSGLSNAGAVLGHMVIDKNGKQCSCGRVGCFETVCSAKALIEETKEEASKNPDSKILEVCGNDLSKITETTAFEAMELGDEGAKKIFNRYTDNMAIALTNLANILMPEVIILCGGITCLGEDLLKPVREKMYECIYSREIALPALKLSEMGSASVLVGAGMLVDHKKK